MDKVVANCLNLSCEISPLLFLPSRVSRLGQI